MNLDNYIRDVKDFPKEGILFKDINPLLANPNALKYTINQLANQMDGSEFDRIGAFDARGFLFGTAIAYQLGKPFFPIRKAGKLPYGTIKQSYGLEYGEDQVEIQIDALNKGDRIILLDDLLATGGTMKAGAKLIERLGGEVISCNFLIELSQLPGRELLNKYDVKSLLKY